MRTRWYNSPVDRMKYEVIIYWSPQDETFIAEMPELTGCMADGKTQGGALANVERVAAEWVQTARKLGRKVPRPRGRLTYA